MSQVSLRRPHQMTGRPSLTAGAPTAKQLGQQVPIARDGRVGEAFDMRKLAALLMVLAVAVVGTGEAFGAAKGTDRPFNGSGSFSGLATIVGGDITVTVDGTQHFTHVGRSTYHVDGVCLNADCTSAVATTTNVAANGDTLIFRETATPGIPFSTFVILGGTGRFAGATGGGTTTGPPLVFDQSNPLAFTGTFESRGTISY